MRSPNSLLIYGSLLLLSLSGASDIAVAQAPELCVPKLTSPKPDAKMPQARTPDGKFETVWTFSWRACAGADRYHLFVIGPGATNPIVDIASLTKPSYTERSTHFGIDDLNGWTWKVRAGYGDSWGDWSAVRQFSIASKASAPTSGKCSIDGRVSGHKGAYNTKIELRRQSDNRLIDTAKVNSSGEYRFASVPGGDYKLVPRATLPDHPLYLAIEPASAAAPCGSNVRIHKNFRIFSTEG